MVNRLSRIARGFWQACCCGGGTVTCGQCDGSTAPSEYRVDFSGSLSVGTDCNDSVDECGTFFNGVSATCTFTSETGGKCFWDGSLGIFTCDTGDDREVFVEVNIVDFGATYVLTVRFYTTGGATSLSYNATLTHSTDPCTSLSNEPVSFGADDSTQEICAGLDTLTIDVTAL